MYTVKQKTVFTKSIKDGSIQTCYLMHITVDTVADIPNAKENWLAGSRCDVLEDGGHVYALSNGREWVQVNFYNLGGESDSTDLSDYYTMSQTDERLLEIEEKILDNINNVGQFYLVDGEVKGEIFNNYTYNVASGGSSHAEGSYTHAEGHNSHAEGSSTLASGYCSHSEGSTTKASGYCSHSEGRGTTASGDYSHSEGHDTKASGYGSHSEGCDTEASGYCSHAGGTGTIAKQRNQVAIGKYNIADNNNRYAFIIGNGSSNTSRQNAFAIDWSGNIYVDNSDTPVNVLDLLNRISLLESKIAELENSENT